LEGGKWTLEFSSRLVPKIYTGRGLVFNLGPRVVNPEEDGLQKPMPDPEN